MGNFWDSHHTKPSRDEEIPETVAESACKLSEAQKERMIALIDGERQMTIDELLIQLPSSYKPGALAFLRAEMLKRGRDPHETYSLRDERLKGEAALARKAQRKRLPIKTPPKVTAETLKNVVPWTNEQVLPRLRRFGDLFEVHVGGEKRGAASSATRDADTAVAKTSHLEGDESD